MDHRNQDLNRNTGARWLTAGGTLALMLTAPAAATADLLGPYGTALKDGTPSLNVRYRFENVDDDGFDKDANLSSVRTLLGYQTGEVNGLSAYLEFSATRAAGIDDRGGDRPGILDDEVTNVNQAYVTYAPALDSELRVGGQRIKLDNDRWVGNVGFRQQEQTYNAARLISGAIPDVVLDLTYAQRVNRIHSFDSEAGDFFFLNARYEGLEAVDITAYGYLLDYDDETTAFFTRSSNTYGLRATGSQPLDAGIDLLYTGEFARQSDAGDYTDVGESYTANYYLAELGLAGGPWTARVGYEVLGSDDGDEALQTPLATLHAFNGWTDQFLANPPDGLVDVYVLANYAFPNDRTAVTGVYRDLSSDEGSTDYGSEVGAQVSHSFAGGYSVELKYARFSADDGIGGDDDDVSKLWVSAGMAF